MQRYGKKAFNTRKFYRFCLFHERMMTLVKKAVTLHPIKEQLDFSDEKTLHPVCIYDDFCEY